MCRRWEFEQKSDEPFVAGCGPVAMHLWEIQRQAMVDQRMLDLSTCPGYLVVRLGQFLQVVVAGEHRIDITLERATTQHLENHGSVLGVVLVPRVEHRLAIA